MTDQEILAGLADIIEDVAGIDIAGVTPGQTLAGDLGLDSLSLVEIAVAAQDTFGTEIPDDRLRGLATVEDVLDCIREHGRAAVPQGTR